MIMRCKKCLGADLVVKVFNDAPGQTQTIKGASATTDFVKNDEAARRGVVKDVRSLAHFHHKCGLSAREIIAGSYARENTVDQAYLRLCCRDEGPGVRQQGQLGHLPDVG